MGKPAQTKPEHEVNAYLFYAQRLLHLKKTAALVEQQTDNMAVMAATCLSLKQAWNAWLKELSVYVGAEIPDYASLFSSEYAQHPEVEALNELSKLKHNWLSDLLKFCEPRLNIRAKQDISEDDGGQSLASPVMINVLQIDPEPSLSEDEHLSQVLTEFKSYINAVRSRQSEW